MSSTSPSLRIAQGNLATRLVTWEAELPYIEMSCVEEGIAVGERGTKREVVSLSVKKMLACLKFINHRRAAQAQKGSRKEVHEKQRLWA